MTPARAAHLAARWVRWYTRKLPAAVAGRRIEEIDADLHDHIAHERARGTGERRIALGVVSRMLRGVAADASWRNRNRPWIGELMKLVATMLVVIAVGIAAMIYGGYDDAPGLTLIGLLMVVGALGFGARSFHRRRRGAGHP
jgi:hypothetical protein